MCSRLGGAEHDAEHDAELYAEHDAEHDAGAKNWQNRNLGHGSEGGTPWTR